MTPNDVVFNGLAADEEWTFGCAGRTRESVECLARGAATHRRTETRRVLRMSSLVRQLPASGSAQVTNSFEEHTMFVTIATGTFHVNIQGPSGVPTLVLLHSLGTNLHLWDPQAEILAGHCRIVQIDLRGHGLSDAPPGSYTMDGLASDVLSILDELGIADFAVAGVSIGGMIAQCLATLAGARVRALLLVDTSLVTSAPEMWRERAEAVRRNGISPLADAIISRWVTTDFLGSAAAAGMRTMLLRTPTEGFAGCAEAIATADLTQRTSAIRLPALIVVGDQDVSTPPDLAEALCSALDGSMKVLVGAAHIPNLEQPQQLAEAMLSFLAANGLTRETYKDK